MTVIAIIIVILLMAAEISSNNKVAESHEKMEKELKLQNQLLVTQNNILKDAFKDTLK